MVNLVFFSSPMLISFTKTSLRVQVVPFVKPNKAFVIYILEYDLTKIRFLVVDYLLL